MKKYIAIVPAETGKQQYIYFFDKATKKLNDVTNFNVPAEINVVSVS